ncbi:methyltransferase [Nocardioides sp. 1609]|uniref:methyltransferase n=1 Tax=Nocardioides sp. 1609 TaxID=2508327 RepID=UPI0010702CDE|nr:methyltransferase [Nocardioides sp. 1609]
MDIIERHSLRFAGLTIEHDRRVLEPRPWTELQSRWAAELLDGGPDGPLLELCSGAGHIGLAAASLSGRAIVCVDLDPAACYFTRLNADGAGLGHRVEVREGSLDAALADGETFALAIADPPWVVTTEVTRFPDDPVLAIDGGPGGLDVAHACVRACRGHLEPGGSLLLQLGDDDQADQVVATAAEAGWREEGRRRAGAGAGTNGGVVVRLLHP